MYLSLRKFLARPQPFEFYTAAGLWTDPHISAQMLQYHLDDGTELASRNSKFIDRSVEWMVKRLRIGNGTRICDLGCGPGLYTTRLAQTGADVTGVDFSASSIKHARETARTKGLAIDYVQADYLELIPIGPFDLITLIYCDFCVLSPHQRHTLLNRIRDHLCPTGLFLLDVCSMRLYDSTEETSTLEDNLDGGFWSASPHFVLNKTFLYPDERLILHKHVVMENDRTQEIFNWLQCYDTESLRAEFAGAGFEIKEFFGSIAGDPCQSESREIAAIATRTA